MKVGDLVKPTDSAYKGWTGIVVRIIPGSGRHTVVYWNKRGHGKSSIPAYLLEVISESR